MFDINTCPNGGGDVNPTSPTSLSDQASPPRRSSQKRDEPTATNTSPAIPTSFRNVSACFRCRSRKHRCDQRLPRCRPCERSQVPCVGYDPITKQEIPRSYLYFLENRVRYLNALLTRHNIDLEPASAFDENGTSGQGIMGGTSVPEHDSPTKEAGDEKEQESETTSPETFPKHLEVETTAAVQTPESSPYLGDPLLDLLAGKAAKRAIMGLDFSGNIDRGASVIRTSFFGLRTETPTKECAPLPDCDEAEKLVALYFAHTNPHLPVLNYEELRETIDRTYSNQPGDHTSYHLFTLFIVFAIGSAVGLDAQQSRSDVLRAQYRHAIRPQKRQKVRQETSTPEEYYASAMSYLARYLSSISSSGDLGNLRELQAMVLLSGFSLLRPTKPGLGKLVDVSMRSAIDLRLYCEKENSELKLRAIYDEPDMHTDWMIDFRRRLWWCVYSLERLVVLYIGRPFSIPDDLITTEFPSTFEDKCTTRLGFLQTTRTTAPYKVTARHYFKLRILQSEIYSVIQSQHACLDRKRNALCRPPTKSSRYQVHFKLWQKDVSRRLEDWSQSIPARGEPGVLPMKLDYWKAILMLYRSGVKVPADFLRDRAAFQDVIQGVLVEAPGELDSICARVAEASQRILQLYGVLKNMSMVSATRMAIHDVYNAGKIVSYPWLQAILIDVGSNLLFAVWNSSLVRQDLTFQHIDYAILGAINFMDTMPDADASSKMFRDSLRQMTAMTMQLCASHAAADESIEKPTSLQTPPTRISSFKDHASRRSGPLLPNTFPGITSPPAETRNVSSTRRCWTPVSQNHDRVSAESTATSQDTHVESGSFSFENPFSEHLIYPFRDYDPHFVGRGTRNELLSDIWETPVTCTDERSIRGSPEIPIFNFDGHEDHTDSSPGTFVLDTVNGQTHTPSDGGQDLLEAYLVGWGEGCPPIVS